MDPEKLSNFTIAADKSGLQVPVYFCPLLVHRISQYLSLIAEVHSLAHISCFFSCRVVKVAIHAIGDKANDMILDMYESVAAANGDRDRRFRVKFDIKNTFSSELYACSCASSIRA